MSEFRCLEWDAGQGIVPFQTVGKCIEHCSQFSPDYAWAGSSRDLNAPNSDPAPLICSCMTNAQLMITDADGLCKLCENSEDKAAARLCGDPTSHTTLAMYSIPGRLPGKPGDPSITSQNPTSQDSTSEILPSPTSSTTVNHAPVVPTSITSSPPSSSTTTDTSPTSTLETVTSSRKGTEPTQVPSSSDIPPASKGNGTIVITTGSNPQPGSNGSEPSSESRNGAIPVPLIIGVASGVLVCILALLAAVVWRRRRKRQRSHTGAEEEENQNTSTPQATAPPASSFETSIPLSTELKSTIFTIETDMGKDSLNSSALWQYVDDHERNVPFSNEDLKKDPELYAKSREAFGDSPKYAEKQ
ncbi:hypothetical protein HDU97_001472 [Phlyctochytrium planicorne]|nr:hypothetical protein HDU97_001472 [Phlyctochytrium planicorne]